MRLDVQERRAQSGQTCRRAAEGVAQQRRVLRSGIAPGKAARPPRPQPAPHRGRLRLPARVPAPAAAALASELGRERRARPLQQVALGNRVWFFCFARGAARTWAAAATTGARELESRDPRPKGRSGRRKAPARLHALQPRRASQATVAVAASVSWRGLPKLPQFIPAESKNRGALMGGLFSWGNRDRGGATERAQPFPGKQLLGICSGN